ncbi:MAG: hypothetical protein J7513_16945 [Solirubrobacteraceae bacterium]|nr:hypothetical protein [Solirubrobacteraceae bacterium]
MIGSPNGVSRHRPFDRWFRYPAGFSETTLRAAIDAARVKDGLVVDCFAGSGSVGTATPFTQADRSTQYVGIEAHPMIAELAAIKLKQPAEPPDLLLFIDELEGAVEPAPVPRSAVPDLIARSFESSTLADLLAWREAIKRRSESEWAPYAKWALLATLRDVASVSVGWPYQRPGRARQAPYADVGARVRARASMMVEDLIQRAFGARGTVVSGDCTKADTWKVALPDNAAAGCVTSPPYLNNFDYADATRLEAYFWGEAATWAELCQHIRVDMLVATTQQTGRDAAFTALEQLEAVPRFQGSVEKLSLALRSEREKRKRGKEYDRLISQYFAGIAEALTCLEARLDGDGRAAWVVGDSAPYGVYVDTPGMILELASEIGFEPIEDRLMRSRGQRWRTNGSRHQLLLSERLIVFRNPR